MPGVRGCEGQDSSFMEVNPVTNAYKDQRLDGMMCPVCGSVANDSCSWGRVDRSNTSEVSTDHGQWRASVSKVIAVNVLRPRHPSSFAK